MRGLELKDQGVGLGAVELVAPRVLLRGSDGPFRRERASAISGELICLDGSRWISEAGALMGYCCWFNIV